MQIAGFGHAFLALTGLVLTSAPATGLQPEPSEYIRVSWTEKDGLPGSAIGAMAQDGDGYLCLISSGGLVRFDGVRLVEWSAIGPAGRAPVRSVSPTTRAARCGSPDSIIPSARSKSTSRSNAGSSTSIRRPARRVQALKSSS